LDLRGLRCGVRVDPQDLALAVVRADAELGHVQGAVRAEAGDRREHEIAGW
jgi:hypothetical protein